MYDGHLVAGFEDVVLVVGPRCPHFAVELDLTLVLRHPIVGLMQRGQFDATAAHNTARALAGLAIGLTAFSIYVFVMRGFYAHQDTRTPFVINVVENVVNIVLAIVLIGQSRARRQVK